MRHFHLGTNKAQITCNKTIHSGSWLLWTPQWGPRITEKAKVKAEWEAKKKVVSEKGCPNICFGRCGMKSCCTFLHDASGTGGFPYRLESTSRQCFWKAAPKQKFLTFFKWRYLQCIHFTSWYASLISRLLLWKVRSIQCLKEDSSRGKRRIREGIFKESRKENAGCNLKG